MQININSTRAAMMRESFEFFGNFSAWFGAIWHTGLLENQPVLFGFYSFSFYTLSFSSFFLRIYQFLHFSLRVFFTDRRCFLNSFVVCFPCPGIFINLWRDLISSRSVSCSPVLRLSSFFWTLCLAWSDSSFILFCL